MNKKTKSHIDKQTLTTVLMVLNAVDKQIKRITHSFDTAAKLLILQQFKFY